MPIMRASTAFLLAALPVLAAAAGEPPIAGEYFCAASGSCPCDADANLHVAPDGSWRWGRHSGTYRVTREQVRFDGGGGTSEWGPATIGPGTLTFNAGSSAVVCWFPPKDTHGGPPTMRR